MLPGDDGSCWVQVLKSGLQMLLNQKTKGASIWMDLGEIAGNEAIPAEIRQGISGSATLLIVMSDGYLASDWCRQELESFIEAAGPEGTSGRIFVVHRDEIPFDRWPEPLRDLIGYPFYLKDAATGDVRPMAVPKPDPQEKEYFARLYRLRNELADQLRRMMSGMTADSASPAAAPLTERRVGEPLFAASGGGPRGIGRAVPVAANGGEAAGEPGEMPTVYLAEVAGDQYEHREQVAQFLAQSGCRVLPAQFYGRDPAVFQAALDQDLAQAMVYAQLLGPFPTPRTAGLPYGYEGLQFQQAVAAEKVVLQWRSPALDPTTIRDDLHRRLLSGPDVLATDLEEFKRLILEEVRKASVQPERELADEDTFILLSAAGDDVRMADDIAARLAEQAVAFDIVDASTSLPDLAGSDDYNGVMIVYGDCPQEWVQQQVRLCRRVVLQKKHAAPECAVYVGPPREKDPLRCRPPRFHIIDDHDQVRLEEFIKAVAKKGATA